MSGNNDLALRLQALDRANEIRLGRTAIKRKLASGAMTFGELLDDVPPCCANLPVHDALLWLPHVGNVRARRIERDREGLIVSETLPFRAVSPTTCRRLRDRVQAATGVPQ